jgi:hypothetical protein
VDTCLRQIGLGLVSLEELYEVWSSAMLSVALLFGMSEVSSGGLLSALLFVALLLGMSELLGSSRVCLCCLALRTWVCLCCLALRYL